MNEPKARRTRTGRTLTDEVIEQLATDVVETEYDVEELKTRRRPGRPLMGVGPAEVFPVRIDPELRAAIEARAAKDHTTASDVIREAIRRFLGVA
ncbi:MAG: ribbon-helix-helix domain-containing protein [Acidimicrobiia bacterium]|nr:MAG: ribbon-helix-helix domain-containing protein [Acidimicrobiia bacterium]